MRQGSVALSVRRRTQPAIIRRGKTSDADAIYALIREHQLEGHLLPRTVDDIRRRAASFVVAEAAGRIQGCAELAPLSATVAEVRSLVVSRDARGKRLGSQLLDQLRRRGIEAGHERLVAFAHDPKFFVGQKFSMVPHQWVPEKIARDCAGCPLFRNCGQHAMVLSLTSEREFARDGARFVEVADAARVAVA